MRADYFIGVLVTIGLAAPLAAAPIVLVEAKSQQTPLVTLTPERILFADGPSIVLKTATATKDDFKDLYVVLMPHWQSMPAQFAAQGQVLAFAPSKFAVMQLAPNKAAALSGLLHHDGMACGTLLKLTGEPIATKMRASPTPIIPVANRDTRVQALTALVQAGNLRTTITELAAINNRYHTSTTGMDVANLLAERYEALRNGRSDVTIMTYDHGNETPQKSLIVRVVGQRLPNEVIILGSHLDSVNQNDEEAGRAPGADDNASGTATNMEVFRVLMEQNIHLDRTLEIHAYAAEEIGLVGSQDIAAAYVRDNINVLAMLQHDMTLWKAPNAPDMIYFVTNNTNAGFNTSLIALAASYAGVPTGSRFLLSGSSDHASWHRQGFAAAFPFENPSSYNRNIHTASDTIAAAGAFTQAAAFAKLGLAYVTHFAGINAAMD